MIPSECEICPITADLDGQVAVRNLLGRDVDQALALLCENSLYYLGDYLWMGPKAFRYYLPAVTKFLNSPTFEAGADDINSVVSTLKFRLKQEPSECVLARNEIMVILDTITTQYERFDIDELIYGDLRSEALNLFESLKNSNHVG